MLDEDELRSRLRQFKNFVGIPCNVPFQSCFGKSFLGLPNTFYRSVDPYKIDYGGGFDKIDWLATVSKTSSKANGGRFNAPSRVLKDKSFEVLYLSGNHETALQESIEAGKAYGFDPNRKKPRLISPAIVVTLARVINLYDSTILDELGLNHNDFSEKWQAKNFLNQESESQVIGRLCFETDAEGILVPSQTITKFYNLDIFTEKFQTLPFQIQE